MLKEGAGGLLVLTVGKWVPLYPGDCLVKGVTA